MLLSYDELGMAYSPHAPLNTGSPAQSFSRSNFFSALARYRMPRRIVLLLNGSIWDRPFRQLLGSRSRLPPKYQQNGFVSTCYYAAWRNLPKCCKNSSANAPN
jgi:hypothetical protein